DQQSSLFGQGCFSEGDAKNTYGTGCFLLMNTGERPVRSENGLITTVAWQRDGRTCYALEGSVFVAGAAVQWLRDELGILGSAPESEVLARAATGSGGVYLVPAFTGLGAPHWMPGARGLLTGLTRGTGRAQIARAALEAIAYQSHDLLRAMSADAGAPICTLKVDGGASANDFLMQFQADLLGARVQRPANTEATAFGAACLAGLAVGFWRNPGEVIGHGADGQRVFVPQMGEEERARLLAGWEKAVRAARMLAE
ncbi:MAG: glycerol kinase, partial [Clostridiales Family XIII bacterium]|nr:glycerol kinase [Clostridiales Family XIII bacterium]